MDRPIPDYIKHEINKNPLGMMALMVPVGVALWALLVFGLMFAVSTLKH